MDRLVSEVVLAARGRQVQSRSPIALADIRLALALPVYLALAWLVPERKWYGLCSWIVTHLRRASPLAGAIGAAGAGAPGGSPAPAIAAQLEALKLESIFQGLREYRPGGWQPAIVLEGREHLDRALAAGRGAVLWVAHTVFHGFALKKCLAEAGFALSHVSRPEQWRGWGYLRSRC
jgi:hypothetical protein